MYFVNRCAVCFCPFFLTCRPVIDAAYEQYFLEGAVQGLAREVRHPYLFREAYLRSFAHGSLWASYPELLSVFFDVHISVTAAGYGIEDYASVLRRDG